MKKQNYYQEEMNVLLFTEDTISIDKNKKTRESQLKNHFKNRSFSNFAGLKNKYEIAIVSLH